MGRRVVRSKKRTYKTYRRRGSHLKKRRKTQTLRRKIRNSFKKNTRKTMNNKRRTVMKRGGRPRADADARARELARDATVEWVASEAGQTKLRETADDLDKFADDYNKNVYGNTHSDLAKKLQNYIRQNIKIEVSRSTRMRDDPQTCLVESVTDFPELFLYFKNEGNCEQTWKRSSKFLGRASKYLERKHGISLRHLTDNYELNVESVVGSGLGGTNLITSGYSLKFVRK